MVQILGQEGPGEQLGQGIGQGVSSGLEMLIKSKMKAMQDMADIQAISNLSNRGTNNNLPNVLNNNLPKDYSVEELLFSEKKIPGSAKLLLEKEKQGKEKYATEQETKNISSSASEILKNLKYAGPVPLLYYNQETREGRGTIDALALEIEKKAADMVGKGTLSKPRFEYLKERLPSSKKTQATNLGLLKAWNKILNLDLPEFKTVPSESEKLTIEEKKDLKTPPKAINKNTGQIIVFKNGKWVAEK